MKNIQDDYNPSKNKNIAWQPFTQLTLTQNKRYEILSTCKNTYVNKKTCYYLLQAA
jgi:hypothetical protein